MDIKFIQKYFSDFIELVIPDSETISKLVSVKKALIKVNKNNKKVIIAGNGGSAAIASHFSVDITKNASIRCVNFNESDLVTCLANDYGYEHWIEKAISFYGDKGDMFIAISSSGQSKNILRACKLAREKEFSSIVTFSGFDRNNPLRKLGDINFWVDSKAYNFVENTHQAWLLCIVDMIIGKAEYGV